MTATPQTYANHVRWHTPFHFVAMPVLLINVVWAIVYCVIYPSWNQGWWILVSGALALVGVLARNNALKVQDRVIRLEERIRYQQLLPADLFKQASSLTVQQMIALRFAADEELEGLMAEVLSGKFTKPAEIKQSIEHWRADEYRV